MGDLIFAARGASFRYRGAPDDAVHQADVYVPRGALVGHVGPNGSGKTTLLHLLLGTLRPGAGTAEAFGRPAAEWRRRDLARRVAVVAQREEPVCPLRVRDAAALGRYQHVGPFRPFAAADVAAVDRTLEKPVENEADFELVAGDGLEPQGDVVEVDEDKEDLSIAVIKRYRNRFQLWISNSRVKDPAEKKLEWFLSIYNDMRVEQGKVCLVGSMEVEFNTIPEGLQAEVEALHRELLDWLETMLAEGREARVFQFPW